MILADVWGVVLGHSSSEAGRGRNTQLKASGHITLGSREALELQVIVQLSGEQGAWVRPAGPESTTPLLQR